jgi:hypothetical protein
VGDAPIKTFAPLADGAATTMGVAVEDDVHFRPTPGPVAGVSNIAGRGPRSTGVLLRGRKRLRRRARRSAMNRELPHIDQISFERGIDRNEVIQRWRPR